jgi:hypothetical protein
VNWHRGPSQEFNFVSLAVPLASIKAEGLDHVLGVAEQLFFVLEGTQGWIAHSEDFDAQHRRALPNGYRYEGQRLALHLPGLYWANLLSKTIVDFIGRERVSRCPAHQKRQLGDGGYLLLTSQRPEDWAADEVAVLRRAMRACLGDDLFFDISAPNRGTRAPNYDFSAVRR